MNKKYRVQVKSNYEWRKYDVCRMEISVGQPYHDGDKLKSMLNWAKNNFNRVCLILGDSLQAYNFAFENNIHIEEARKIAIEEGDKWIERNEDVISDPKFILYRCDYWRNKKDYDLVYKQIKQLYLNNERFRNTISSTVNETWDRRSKSMSDIYFPERKLEFVRLSTEFLMEETAILAMAYEEIDGISAYPGSFLEMWSMFVNDNIEEAPTGLTKAHCVSLKLKSKK